MINENGIKVSKKGYNELQKRINRKGKLNSRHRRISQFVNGDIKMGLSNNAIRIKWHISRESIIKIKNYDN